MNELPPLPEWSKRDDLGGLVPSEIRQALVAYARAAVSAAVSNEPGRSEREIAWTDEDGVHHSMPQCAVESLLERFWDEWPGGWPEVEAEKRARALSAPTAPAPTEPTNVRERWNVEPDGADLLVCFNSHDKGEKCGYHRYAPKVATPSSSPSDAERLDWIGLKRHA